MASTATSRSAKPSRRGSAKAPKRAAPSLFEPTGITGKLTRKAAKKVAGGALKSGARLLRVAAERVAAAGGEAVGRTRELTEHRRLPIQRSIDIAVPVRVAWGEWMAFEFIPEGVHTVTDVDFDGERLAGRISGPHPADWSADIIDERDEQSFAWQSHEGSDCAGLVTFHELSDRLTRIELNLDVVPTTIAEAIQLTTHLADHRAERDLRYFKARLELISPDLYDEDETDGATEPEDLADDKDNQGEEDR